MLNEKEYKVMKRIYLIFISLGIVMLSACSTGDSSSPEGNDNSSGSNLSMVGTLDKTRVIETDAGAGVNTSSMTTSWTKTDKILVLFNGGTSGSPSYFYSSFVPTSAANGYFRSTTNSTQAQINGYINNPAIAMNMTNGADTINVTASSNNTLTGTVSYLDKQDGTLGNVSHYDLLYASSTSNGVSQKPFTFHHAMCVIRLDMCNLSRNATYVKSATITYTPTGSTPQMLATSASYTYDGTNFTQSSAASTTSMTINCPTGVNKIGIASGGKASIYLVVPGSTTANAYSGTLNISVTTDDNSIRSCNVLFSNKTLNPGSLYAKAVAIANFGMFYFSDGTWGRLADYPGKTPIAIIFYAVTSAKDFNKGWTHGYAMALKNAAVKVNWGPINTDTSLPNSFTDTTLYKKDMDGYTNTQTIKTNYTLSNYPAFKSALNYPVTAPPTSSGWYLPSSGQWFRIALDLSNLSLGGDYLTFLVISTTNTSDGPGSAYQWTRASTSQSTATYFNNYLSPLSSSLYDSFADGTWFWDSTESTKDSGGVFLLNSSTVTTLQRSLKNSGSGDPNGGYVRPVIAF